MDALIDAVFSEGFALFTIVVLFFGGGTVARAWHARIARKTSAQKQQFELQKAKIDLERAQLEAKKPICLCGHGANFHDRALGACSQMTQRPNQWNDEGVATGYENVSCPCVDYVGPAPGITGSILGELNER